MRMLATVTIPTGAGNEAIKSGRLESTIQSFLQDVRPESAVFGLGPTGVRTAYLVIDMAESNDMTNLFEPLMVELEACVTLLPVMNADELAAGLARL